MLLVIAQRGDDLLDDLARHLKVLERFTETRGKFLLFEARKIALPAITGAAVVDVLAFLDLPGNAAAVVCAVRQATEGDLLRTVLWAIVTGEHCLHGLEGLPVNE